MIVLFPFLICIICLELSAPIIALKSARVARWSIIVKLGVRVSVTGAQRTQLRGPSPPPLSSIVMCHSHKQTNNTGSKLLVRPEYGGKILREYAHWIRYCSDIIVGSLIYCYMVSVLVTRICTVLITLMSQILPRNVCTLFAWF